MLAWYVGALTAVVAEFLLLSATTIEGSSWHAFYALPAYLCFFMKGTGPQRAEPPALKICIKKLLPKGSQSSDKRTIKWSKDLQR